MDNSWWDDFSNNLATDLAPLIALFGEAATKQYLSECLTVEDIVIFAVAPLGVITAVVSAIRVCGTPSLRAFVGRAQEGAGTAEAELCSSTSRDVCELYSNGGIARVFGRPKLLEIVHDTQTNRDEFYPSDGSEATAGIYSFPKYIKTKRGMKEWTLEQKFPSTRRRSVGSNESGLIQVQRKTVFAPNPNLSLNIGIKPLNRLWFLAAATLGVILQLFILVWATLTRYYFRWLRNGREDQYSVPLTVIGTILLCLGMAECAHLIESKTKEQIYQRVAPVAGDAPSNMYWVQPGNQSIGDQFFDSFAYSDSKQSLQKYITSWKDTTNRPSTMVLIWAAVITTCIGFICQFLGLRAAHSSVAIAQLGVTIFMSAIRAGLRSQRLRTEDNFMADVPEFYEGHELDYLALKLGQQRSTPSSTKVQQRPLWRVFNSISRSSIPQTIHATSADNSRGSPILERLSVKYEQSTVLAGFRIQSIDNRFISLKRAAMDRELVEWMSAEYCSECKDQCVCGEDPCKRDPSATVKAFLYRARLSRMTGIEGPKSTLSSYWGEEFVNVRSISLALSDAIEETMRILFSSEGSSPVVLHKPWEDALSIFWAIQCSLIDPSTKRHKESIIHMSLRRSINEDAVPGGPWRVNRSEIEAVLGLWLWSLKETRKRNDVLEDVDEEKTLQRINRILFIKENDTVMSDETAELNDWRESGSVEIRQARLKVQHPGIVDISKSNNELKFNNIRYPLRDTMKRPDVQNALWWRGGESTWQEAYVTGEWGPPLYSHLRRRFFGWYWLEQSPPYNELQILYTDSPNSLLGNCALEMYSSFFSAVMHAVKDIGGDTHLEEHKDKLTVRNQTIQSIQATLIRNGLCNAGDAFACIIPILKCQDKLPVPNEIVSGASEIAYKHFQQGNWRLFRELMAWVLRRSKMSLVAAYNQQDPTKRLNAINDFRLSFIETCEAYRQILLRDYETSTIGDVQGILQLVERYSEDETIKNIPLVWHDVGNVPDTQARTGQSLSLADTLICYGEAALWSIRRKQSLPDLEERYLEQLKKYTSSKEVASSPEQALERSDLSSLLYFLQSSTLQGSIQLTDHFLFKTMIATSEKGWFMVTNSLVEHGASIDQEDDNGRTALSYAAELGDINTASTLMDLGASLCNRNNDDRNRKLAIHFAAKQGHATIIRHMLKSFSGSSGLDYEDEEGMTPLSWAITSGNAATVLELTREGSSISPNAYDTKKPALHLAIQEDKEEIVDVLLKSEKVDPNHLYGETIDSPPLIHAIRLRKEGIFDKLLNFAKVRADYTDTSDRTAIWWAAALGLDTYVQKLLDSGKLYHPHGADKNGHTPLSIAAEGGRIAIVRQLLRIEGADFAIKPIIIAAMKGHIAVVEELLASNFHREDSKSLLEANKLGHVWIQIQQSKLWEDVDGERLRIPSGFELKDLKDSELTFAEDLYNQPYEKLV
ncbi:uncharacterized protein TrAtP1_009724 [Trichoderma atroviride]|uniref:Ankyrin repeat protein n=1 Tax=Hypocrea atroviridis (strain ATCC 20476 / IMI 206040) TaxID=452589 RepID=G9NKU8_HYPAI|nr:putative ankyrin repeat protein [Trichoderma atroviride IMI 206040]EHK48861.1 putative ankyrin repeat protein [Trichoderma atroviride IMI 206040]UKZ68701.1 hypothetical protein TrAtP1_009724 [Trichoderma atroviride]